MTSKSNHRVSRAACGLIALAIGAAVARAQAPAYQPENIGPAPLLAQLSQETAALHRAVSASFVRVHLPDRNDAVGPAEELLRKWEQRLEPAVKQKLMEQEAALRAMRSALMEDPFATQHVNGDRPGSVLTVHVFDMPDLADNMPLGFINAQRGRVSLAGTVGIVLDDHGLVLVPAFVDRDPTLVRPIRVSLNEGGSTEAALIGSDKQTGMTLIRLSTPTGHPAVLAEHRPEDGSIVMTFATQSDSAHLSVWSEASHDAGVVVTPDGKIAGFANQYQFLAAPSAARVIHQLADHGEVRRPVLGIHVTEVHRDDPGRLQVPMLGNQPALHVDAVIAKSPADQNGIRPGDLILSIGQEPVGDVPSFAAALAEQSGSTDIRILRDGVVLTMTLAAPAN